MKIFSLPSALLALGLFVSACSDDSASVTVTLGVMTMSTSTDGSSTAPSTLDPTSGSTGTTTSEPTTSTSSTGTSTTAVDSSTTAFDTTNGQVTTDSSSSSTGDPPPDCDVGEPFCACINGVTCNDGAMCMFGECPVVSGMCQFELDGYCDEPDSCAPGTDIYDCCATPKNGVCEEVSGGGTCAKGSDWWDCSLCPYTDNNFCDEPNDCPPDSDPECDYCEYANDGYCDEPFLCPPGSDGDDCCATPQNGVCEELGMGGMCPPGSDSWDCGSCPYANDGYCDEPDLCPPDSDGEDCCATPDNGVCEEVDQGGICPEGSDFSDCGECPWKDDGYCDEPDLCLPGTDGDDCCATPENGVCEEVDQGGVCPEGSDFSDCGECPWKNDGFCDEPFECPPGSDGDDCCATPQNGMCEEIGQGGVCSDGSDFYDCGECPYTDDFECDEPFLCPPGSDANDCN